MTNDNRRPMSPLGKMIFDMANDLNQAYARGLRQLDKPFVADRIKRVSTEKNHDRR